MTDAGPRVIEFAITPPYGTATPSADILEVAKTAIKDPDVNIRQAALNVAHRQGPSGFPVLIEALKDKGVGGRGTCAWALGVIRSEGTDVVPALIEALKDTDADVRRLSAWALGEFGLEAKDAVPALIEAVKDTDADVRQASDRALRQIE